MDTVCSCLWCGMRGHVFRGCIGRVADAVVVEQEKHTALGGECDDHRTFGGLYLVEHRHVAVGGRGGGGGRRQQVNGGGTEGGEGEREGGVGSWSWGKTRSTARKPPAQGPFTWPLFGVCASPRALVAAPQMALLSAS